MFVTVNWLSAFGILLDIVGAAWIAKALAFSGDRDLLDQAASRWDLNALLLKVLEVQRLDARCGLGVLAVGFGMQFAGVFVPAALAWFSGATAFIVLVLAAIYHRRTLAHANTSRSDRVTRYIQRTGNIPD